MLVQCLLTTYLKLKESEEKIETYGSLRGAVELDSKEHDLKNRAILLLNAMNDWPTLNQTLISDFVVEIKTYFGTPLTIEGISKKKFNDENAWELEAGSFITELLESSINIGNEPNFDLIVAEILTYYNRSLIDDFGLIEWP